METPATPQYGNALQTVDTLCTAIAHDPVAALSALRSNVDHLVATEADLKLARQEIQSLTNTITTLNTQINLLQASESDPPLPTQQANTNPFYQHSTIPHRSAKLADPDKFTGKRNDLPNFLAQLQLKLQANSDHWPNEEARIAYCISRLEGDALRNL